MRFKKSWDAVRLRPEGSEGGSWYKEPNTRGGRIVVRSVREERVGALSVMNFQAARSARTEMRRGRLSLR